MVSGSVYILASALGAMAAAPLPQAQGRRHSSSREAICAVEIPATRLSATDFSIPGRPTPTPGVVLDYTTEADLVGRLRDMVRRYAAVQNGGTPVAEQVGDPALGPGVAGAPPGTAVLVPGARASVADTPAGARLTLVPVTPEMRRLLHAAADRQRRSPSRRPCPPDVRLDPDARQMTRQR